MKVKLDKINVGDRERIDFGDIEGLAVSIQRFGLLHPIVIDRDNNLIAGERRYRAHQLLKQTEIEVKFLDEVSDIEKKEIEIEENIKRKNFTWQEEVKAQLSLYNLKKKIHGASVKGHETEGWGIKEQADALEKSVGSVHRDLAVAKALEEFPELAEEKNKDRAIKKFKKLQQNMLMREQARRRFKEGQTKAPNIIHGDALEELGKMEDETVDFFNIDPPFGVNLDEKSKTDSKGVADASYSDNPFEIMENLRKVFKEMYRVLRNDRHTIVAFAMQHYTEMFQMLTEAGFSVEPTPLIWNKESGSTPANGKYFTFAYEPAFWCKKGNRELFTTPCNVFTYKRVPQRYKYHPLERPQALLQAWIEACTHPGELCVDCFAGGGSLMEACIYSKRRSIIIEKNKMHYTSCITRLEDIQERGKPIEV